MRCVILQPSYLPWRGFFDLIHRADVFVWYDDVQFDKNGWRNRNKIKTATGPQWITVPVRRSGHIEKQTPINAVPIDWTKRWDLSHIAKIRDAYRAAPFFERYMPLVEELLAPRYDMLADLAIESAERLAKELGINDTRFMRSSTLGIQGRKTERLVDVLRSVGADSYLSGPSARDYIEADKFEDAGIQLDYISYDYPEYEQIHGEYSGQVSVIDLLFMKGPEASRYIWNA